MTRWILRTTLVAALAFSGAATGCTHPATQSGARPDSNVLTQSQLNGTNADNVYDAIARLRPSWLSSRGPTSTNDPTPTSATVFMNGVQLGAADYLRQVRIIDVTEVRYWDAGQATARFGTGHPRGVIEIIRQ